MNFDEQISSMLKSIRNLVSILNTCKAKYEINVYKKKIRFRVVIFFSIRKSLFLNRRAAHNLQEPHRIKTRPTRKNPTQQPPQTGGKGLESG